MSLETGQEQETVVEEQETQNPAVPDETTAEPTAGTATPSEPTETNEPEITEDDTTQDKTFTQEELDSIVEKRLARERRKIEREQQESAEPPPLQIESQLDPESFETTEAYIEALATERAEALIQHKEKVQSTRAANAKYQDQIDAALEKYPDYVEVAHSHPHMTQEMATVIRDSDIATDLGYYLGSNLEEAEKISKLPPIQQVKALGRLEEKLSNSPPTPTKASEAPAPIKPVVSNKTSNPSYDTTDARSVSSMSTSEWIAKDRARREKKLREQGYK